MAMLNPDRTYRFRITEDNQRGIQCLLCDKTSWNQNDVDKLYCGSCHIFHEPTSVLGKPDYHISGERNEAAQRRSTVIFDRLRPQFKEMSHLRSRAIDEPNLKRKIIWLWRVVHPLKKATEDLVACKKGCAHCCYTPVVLSHTEAEVIAERTGRAMTSPKSYAIEPNLDYVRQPCPFLENNHCSIYDSRPFICRVHYNVDTDPSQCVLGEKGSEAKPVMLLNVASFHETYTDAIGKRDLRYADIRDFFPK